MKDNKPKVPIFSPLTRTWSNLNPIHPSVPSSVEIGHVVENVKSMQTDGDRQTDNKTDALQVIRTTQVS